MGMGQMFRAPQLRERSRSDVDAIPLRLCKTSPVSTGDVFLPICAIYIEYIYVRMLLK